MKTREEVIRALEICIGDVDDNCDYCPYSPEYGKSCNGIEATRDALALLEGEEPRLVTTADFENNPNLDDGYHLNVWEEYKDGARCGWDTINVNDVRAFTDLRRYWTSRPTPEQMANTPWEVGETDG